MICCRMVLVMMMLVLVSPSGWSQVVLVPGIADGPQAKSMARGMFHFTVDENRGEKMALVSSLMKSKSLQREAVQMTMKSKEEQAKLPEIIVVATWRGDGEYEISLQSFDEHLPAEKVLEALREVLAAKLLTVDTTRTSLENQLAQEQPRVAGLAAKLSAERGELTKLAVTNRVELDPAVAVQKRIRLETEWQILKVEAQGIVARKDAIEHQIADLAKKAAAIATTTDVIYVELTKSIAARRKVVESRQALFAAGGQISLESVEQAKDELAQAEVELANYRRTLADAAGGQRMADLQRRLDDAAIDRVEVITKLHAIENLSDQARQHSAEVEAKRIEVELLEQDYRRAREELSQLESKLRQHVSPSVTLIPLN